jgi:hypothetical protein
MVAGGGEALGELRVERVEAADVREDDHRAAAGSGDAASAAEKRVPSADSSSSSSARRRRRSARAQAGRSGGEASNAKHMRGRQRYRRGRDRGPLRSHRPRRAPAPRLDRALATVREWAERQGIELVQVRLPGQEQEVAPRGEVGACDLVMALGGDGTTLAALRSAAPHGRPVHRRRVREPRAPSPPSPPTTSRTRSTTCRAATTSSGRLPALVARAGRGDADRAQRPRARARRRGPGHVRGAGRGERFIRLAGDGWSWPTPLGSSAYTLAAGGPMLVRRTRLVRRRCRPTAASARRSSPARRAALT